MKFPKFLDIGVTPDLDTEAIRMYRQVNGLLVFFSLSSFTGFLVTLIFPSLPVFSIVEGVVSVLYPLGLILTRLSQSGEGKNAYSGII